MAARTATGRRITAALTTLLAAGALACLPATMGAPVTSAAAAAPEVSGAVGVSASSAQITSVAPVRASRPCRNALVRTLRKAGFHGEGLHEAWAIAMRESNGHAKLGPGSPQFNGHDFGLFQFNKPTWGTQRWWKSDKAMLDGVYNARIAWKMSKNGRTWYPWGLTGRGHLAAGAYTGWADWQIQEWILKPYRTYYKQFRHLPSSCR